LAALPERRETRARVSHDSEDQSRVEVVRHPQLLDQPIEAVLIVKTRFELGASSWKRPWHLAAPGTWDQTA
jgi:hypothetical protein